MGSWGEDLLQRVLCMGRMQRAPENSPRGPDEEDPPTQMQKLTAVSQGVSGKLQETLVTMPKAAAEAAAAGVAAGAAVMRTFKKSDLQEFRDPEMAHSSIVKSAALRAMARGCVSQTLDPTGRYEVLRYGQKNPRMRLNTAKVFGTSITELMSTYRVSVAVTLFMRELKHMAILFLLLFCFGIYGSYNNFQRNSLRNECRGRLASEYVTVTNLPTECGYQGLPVRGSVPRMPFYLRFGIGGCEEYSAATTVTMPRGAENPFLDTPDAAFCATGAPTTRQAWLGFFGVALLVGYSIWLRWYIQHRGKCADTARLTAADYAILLTGLRTNEEVDGKEGLQEKLYQDLEELGFARRQIDHIAFGARCRKQIKILREIAGMNVQEQELKAKADEDGLAKLQAKRQKLVGKFELVIEGAALSTGQAVVVFKAESDRVSFQNALEKGQASRLRLFWSSTATPVLSRSRSAWAMVPLRFEAAPEPDAIVWENLELGDGRELAIKVLGLIGVAGLLVAGGLLLIKLKDLAALLKADESGGLAVLSTVAASPTRGEASGAHALFGIIFELFDVFVGVPFDQAIHRMIAYLQGVGLPVSRMKLVLSLTCAVVVGLVNAITKAFIKVMARLQGLDTLTELEGTLFSRLSLVLVANTVVVPFAVEVVNTWRVSGGTAIVDQSWYEPGGVISTGISLVIIDALAKFPLLLLPPGPFVKRILSLFPRFATSHGKIFKLWEPPELMAAENYAALITSLALCLLYAPFFPPLYLISAAGLALNLWSFKVAVIKWYKRPPSFNEEMGETLRKVVSRLVLPVHLVSFYLSMVNASFDPPLVPVYAAMGLGCGYIVLDLFVLPLLPAFQDYNQLSGSGDSMGINYDEVAAHAKYEVDFYAFPRLRSTEELDHIIRDGAPLRISRTPPTANKNVLSAVKVCQLAQEPWIDLGANVEDESAPPSTDVAKHYRTMPTVGIKWDAPAGGVAPRSSARADKDEAAALL